MKKLLINLSAILLLLIVVVYAITHYIPFPWQPEKADAPVTKGIIYSLTYQKNITGTLSYYTTIRNGTNLVTKQLQKILYDQCEIGDTLEVYDGGQFPIFMLKQKKRNK